MNKLLIMPVLLVTISCGTASDQKSTSTSDGVTAEEAAANRARPYVEGMKALNEYKVESGCDGPYGQDVADNLDDAKEMVYNFNDLGMQLGGFMKDYADQAKSRHQDLAFSYADTALEKGCLNTADSVYRSLVSFYTGTAYGGIRDRARIGIDDVRSMQD